MDSTRALSAGGWAKQGGGFYSFENGHLLCGPTGRTRRTAELGPPRGVAKQFGRALGLDGAAQPQPVLDPNGYLMDQFSSQIRHYRAIAVDKPMVTISASRPRARRGGGAGAAHPPVRGLLQRLRHGDAGRPGGVPRCQFSYLAARAWNDMSRGAKHWIDGPDAAARATA